MKKEIKDRLITDGKASVVKALRGILKGVKIKDWKKEKPERIEQKYLSLKK